MLNALLARCRGELLRQEAEGDLAEQPVEGRSGLLVQRQGEWLEPDTNVLVEQGPAQGAGMMSGARALSARRNPR